MKTLYRWKNVQDPMRIRVGTPASQRQLLRHREASHAGDSSRVRRFGIPFMISRVSTYQRDVSEAFMMPPPIGGDFA